MARHTEGSVASSSAWLLGERTVQLASTVVFGLLVARFLGPEEFGVLAYANAALALTAPALTALHPVLLKEFSASRVGASVVLRAAWSVSWALGLTTFGIAVALAVARSADLPIAVTTVIVATTALGAPLLIGEPKLISAGRARAAAVIRSLGTLVGGAGRVGIAALGLGAAAVAGWGSTLVLCTAGCLFLAAGGWHLLRASDPVPIGPERRAIWNEGWPLILSGLAIAVYMSSDQLLLGLLSDDSAVGNYAVAVRAVEGTYLVPTALAAAAGPAIARAFGEDHDRYLRLLRRLVLYSFLGALGAGVLVSLIGVPMIRIAVGDEFGSAPALILYLVPATLFVALGVAQTPWIVNEHHTRFQLVRTAIGAAINVGLNLVFIPRFGAAGAAWATVIAYGCVAVLANALFAPARPYLRLQVAALRPRRALTEIRLDLGRVLAARATRGGA